MKKTLNQLHSSASVELFFKKIKGQIQVPSLAKKIMTQLKMFQSLNVDYWMMHSSFKAVDSFFCLFVCFSNK